MYFATLDRPTGERRPIYRPQAQYSLVNNKSK